MRTRRLIHSYRCLYFIITSDNFSACNFRFTKLLALTMLNRDLISIDPKSKGNKHKLACCHSDGGRNHIRGELKISPGSTPTRKIHIFTEFFYVCLLFKSYNINYFFIVKYPWLEAGYHSHENIQARPVFEFHNLYISIKF